MAAAPDAAARSLESGGFSEVLKLDNLRPPEMLLETARRRNSDTDRGPVVGSEMHGTLLSVKLQHIRMHRKRVFCYFYLGYLKKKIAHNKEIARD